MEITDKQIEQFVAAAHEIGARKLTRCSSGNLSWRIGERALVSATGSWVPELRAEQVSICRLDTGEWINGVKPSMESTFHLAVLRNRPEINVVLHCQSIYATTVACMKKRPSDFNVTAELPCHCGREIAFVPYYRPGSPELAAAVVEAMREHDSVLLEKHGQVFVGKDFKNAIEKAEFLEMACEIMIHSGMEYRTLTGEEIRDLDKYILGKVCCDG
ncbi:MAG: class II aldolase/adducin family protein [Culturomica sp.]|nr:class II aldolase/adducin family protein [Culturomica sp.]